MAITDELREYIDSHLYLGARCLGGWKEVALLIADRIDAEHERAMADAELAAAPTEAQLEKLGYIALPLDADGVPIHVGDRLEHVNGAFTANDLTVSIDGLWRAWDGENGHTVLLSKCRHYAQTVEDVLREFANECLTYATCVDDHEVQDAIEEYAARLRLAEEVDA